MFAFSTLKHLPLFHFPPPSSFFLLFLHLSPHSLSTLWTSPSLEISHHCLPQVVFFLASLLPPSKRKQDKERNGKEKKACQATGKYGVAGWGGAESGFEQAELEELVKVQQAAGQSRYGP